MGAWQIAAGLALDAGPLYYVGAAGSVAHALWQVHDVKLDVPEDCLAKFKSNYTLGGIFMTGAVADRIIEALADFPFASLS